VDTTPPTSITDDRPDTLILFDCRDDAALARMDREKNAWGTRASVERLDDDHVVLLVRAGGAQRLAS
jgi:hypothetical protein